MKKTVLATLLAAGVLPLSAQADTIFGIYAGAAQWTQEYSGTFGSSDSNQVCIGGCNFNIDLNDDLGLDEEKGTTLWLAIEHPVPVLPNLKIERNELKTDATSELSRDITYGDETYSANTTIATDFDLSHTDYVLYYEVLDNWVSLDVGIDVKQFDGNIRIRDVDGVLSTAEEELDAPIPMLYLAAKFDLPLSGLSFGAQGSAIDAGGASLKDIRFNIGYEFAFGLGIEAGHRNMTIEIDADEEDVFGDLEFKGNYVAATFHF
ncbi:MAG TPA: TIGR04219 family outer membrane beta-barrel protein [Permianibacter sp.]|nr:TIGR04219 family outer membrane beta-barrel protein [Permianibacter sp.]